MNTKKCDFCKHNYNKKDKKCPKCGSKNNSLYSEKTIAGFITIGIFVTIIFGVIYLFNSNSDNDNENYAYTNMLAYQYAEKEIKKRLKSPRTAKFPSLNEKNKHSRTILSNLYKINSWVDSENSFGAMIRTRFSCEVSFNGSDVMVSNIKIK